MAEDSRYFVPQIPSLLHITVVKVAIELHEEFGIDELEEAFRRMQLRNSEEVKDSDELMKCHKAKKKLLGVPPRLRRSVREAIHGLKGQVQRWRDNNVMGWVDEAISYQWRFDGTLDSFKTARKLVVNANIDIRKRFYIACTYCLVEVIQQLWKEINYSDEMTNIDRLENPVVRFWITWMNQGFKIPWQKAVLNYLEYPRAIRFYSFFPALRVEERKKILLSLCYGTEDDFLLCLYAMTEVEQWKLLLWCPCNLLRVFLEWPHRRLFIETAERIWRYIDEISYRFILCDLLTNNLDREIFDFRELFECFWISSHDYLKEKAMEVPFLKRKIDICLEEMRRKRKAHFDELKAFKKKCVFKKHLDL